MSKDGFMDEINKTDNRENSEILESSLMKEIVEKEFHKRAYSFRGYESKNIDALAEALAGVQIDIELIKPSKKGFQNNSYATLADLVKTCRPALSKKGLAIIQRVMKSYATESITVLTRLCHNSGQWIESVMSTVPENVNIQGYGSMITYMRRYCYAAIIGAVADDDDDAQQAMGFEKKRNYKPRNPRNTNASASAKKPEAPEAPESPEFMEEDPF